MTQIKLRFARPFWTSAFDPRWTENNQVCFYLKACKTENLNDEVEPW